MTCNLHNQSEGLVGPGNEDVMSCHFNLSEFPYWFLLSLASKALSYMSIHKIRFQVNSVYQTNSAEIVRNKSFGVGGREVNYHTLLIL